MQLIPPLPSQPVPPPPWSNYNTKVSILHSMKKKLGHMDTEMYPLGQNPGYSNPWVTMPHPVIPAPNTLQYGGPWPTARSRSQIPSQTHGGWVQAHINSKIDTERETLAEKLQDTASQFYAQVNGWFLSFYEGTYPSIGRLLSNIDLRYVRRVQMMPELLGNVVVSLILESGSFEFHVPSRGEAEGWCAAITAVILGWSQLRIDSKVQRPSSFSTLPRQSESSSVVPRRNELSHSQLRHAWAACVRAVSQGNPAPTEAFEHIFSLYDQDHSETLSLQEIRSMLKDLLALRNSEAQHALERHIPEVQKYQRGGACHLDFKTQSRLSDAARNASALGTTLVADYARLSDSFESRCILLQSQLDLSADQLVALPEFLAAAPRVLLPESELKAEAQFYNSISFILKLTQKAQPADLDCDDAGICVHQ
ncbi:unnamed protein product [Durusdinium trenchii]|uniref:EF-hand domain-containing protein n=2 Tax=Durusdinium trenchii TaxID=1381693 RepID=A0ABP0KRA8_9DINO